jgi:hypothetical protein
MNVSEEPDSGILPMNHSNKVEQSMAESEEGRPLIKENTHQSNTRRHRAGPACHSDWRVCGKQQGTQGDEVHPSAPLCHDRSIKGQRCLVEAQSRSRSGWHDMGGV